MAPPIITGFTTIVQNRIYRRDAPSPDQPADPSHPDTILIFGWGDGLPKHVSKYCDGYHALFPTSTIYMILTPIFSLITHVDKTRVASMLPLVDDLFPQPATGNERILLHMMSNTGAVYGAGLLVAYQERHGSSVLPHTLAVCDSTPGGLDFSKEVPKWSKAMALGLAGYFPWPFMVTQGICRGMLTAAHYAEKARGELMAGSWAKVVFSDKAITDERGARLYLYSKEDEIIGWDDVEEAAELSRELGWRVFTEIFEGTGHVAHMRQHPEQYWGVIDRSWKASIEGKSADEVRIDGEVKAAVESATV